MQYPKYCIVRLSEPSFEINEPSLFIYNIECKSRLYIESHGSKYYI